MQLNRCGWVSDQQIYLDYHDFVWGRPVMDELELFEKLCLDGQQAGLSWITILKKQHHYKEAYDNFDPEKIARYDQRKVTELLQNSGIIRNKLKVESIIKNARGFLAMKEKGINFSEFIWDFVDGKTVVNQWQTLTEVPVSTEESKRLSKALKNYGFNFVGETIVYAFMQAVGMVNDHLVDCHCYYECCELARK